METVWGAAALQQVLAYTPLQRSWGKIQATAALNHYWAGAGREGRTILLAGACGHGPALGMPSLEKNANPYAHRLASSTKVEDSELETLYREGENLYYSSKSLQKGQRENWASLTLLVRQQVIHPRFSLDLTREASLAGRALEVGEWCAGRVFHNGHSKEDARILVAAALRAYHLDEKTWEALKVLSGELPALNGYDKPWSALQAHIDVVEEVSR